LKVKRFGTGNAPRQRGVPGSGKRLSFRVPDMLALCARGNNHLDAHPTPEE